MRINSFLIVLFIFLLSCETKENKYNSLIKISNSKNGIDSTFKDNVVIEQLDFELFIDKINKDCKFQKSRIKFPLESISLVDMENNTYDTIFVTRENYECMEFTSPRSNVSEGEVILKFNHVSETEKIILLQVEGTGIHIQYFFNFKNNIWSLVKILDEST